MIDEKKIPVKKSQNLILENRQKLSLSGINAVDSFNDEIVIVETDIGLLVIRGQSLKIQKLNLENGELLIDGEVAGCEYSNPSASRQQGSGLFSKLFK